MTERIRQHIDNVTDALGVLKGFTISGRPTALATTHLEESRHMFRMVLRQLEQLGVEDKYGVPFDRGVEGAVKPLISFLEKEIEELRATALSTFEYSGTDKDIVLHLQSVYTAARIHVECALAWVNEINN